MAHDEELRHILGQLGGSRLEDVTDQLIALFRVPAWWEEAFEAHFGAQGASGALPDPATRHAVKACIRTLLTRVHHEERQILLREIERLSEAFLARDMSPAALASARQLYTWLRQGLRQADGEENTPAGER